jgi:CubicO group peptidase (beta-lactamase class C family)
MSLGSITKQFTALVFPVLCERGQASLDAPIGSWLPEIHPSARRVAVRELLGHVSGLRDATDFVYQLAEASRWVSSLDIVEFYRDIADVNFEPCQGFNYNNAGYILVGVIIERISGHPLEGVFRNSGVCASLQNPLIDPNHSMSEG